MHRCRQYPALQDSAVHEEGSQKVMIVHGPDAKSSDGERQGAQQDSMHEEGIRAVMTLQCVGRHRSAKLVQAGRTGVGLGGFAVEPWRERS